MHLLTCYQAVSVNKEQAALLVCKKNTPAMRIINRGILEGGRVFEISEIVDINYSCSCITPFTHHSLAFRTGNQGV